MNAAALPHAAVIVRRTIDAPAEMLFDAFLEPMALSEWMRPGAIEFTVMPSLATVRERALAQMCTAPFGGLAAFMIEGSSPPVMLMIRPNFLARITGKKAWARRRPAV